MGPEVEIHRDIAICYGYSIRDDVYYAHFDFPENAPRKGGFQREVLRGMRAPRSSAGTSHVMGADEAEARQSARAKIDAYLQ